jgi:chitin-binding protein
LVTALTVVIPSSLAFAHGSMKDPISRIYSIYLEGPKSPDSDAAQAAVAECGTQPFYDWNEVVNFFPGTPSYQQAVPYEQHIPDGRLASADNDKYACLDMLRDDWPATQMQSGPYEFVWYATTPHNPSVFRAWLTTDDWDPVAPLNWAQMVELELGDVAFDGNEYRFETVLPERTGRHVLYVIWQRIDPVGEGFYSVSDLMFGDAPDNPSGACCIDEGCNLLTEASCLASGGEYNGDNSLCADAGCDGGLQGPDSISIKLVNEWPNGYQAEMTVTNSVGDLPMLEWELTFEDGPDIQIIWNAVFESGDPVSSILNDAFNGFLDPGESTSFGFNAQGSWPPVFSHAELNGMHVHVEGAGDGGHDPCPGDFNEDMTVNVADLLILLKAWGTVDLDIDVDGDTLVGVAELLHLLSLWGNCH